jgi:hypothetical protein
MMSAKEPPAPSPKTLAPEPGFTSKRQRMLYLFGLYEQLTAALLAPAPRKMTHSRFPDAEEAFCRGGYSRHLDLHR